MSNPFAPITYQLRSGNYVIDNFEFRLGDRLIYSSGIAVSIFNGDPGDSIIDVLGVFNGLESLVRLRVPRDKDGLVTDIPSFNQAFGEGSLTFDPAIIEAQVRGNTVNLQGNAGPGISSVGIFIEGVETPLGFASVTNGIWFFTIPELAVGNYNFLARGIFSDGEQGDDSLIREVSILETIPLVITPNHLEIFELPSNLNTVTYFITGRAGTTVQLAISPDSEARGSDISVTGLSGDNRLILGTNGTATFSVTALQDDLTEISEVLRVSVSDVDNPDNNATADVTIRDFLPLTLTPNLTEIFEQPGTPNTVLYTITGMPETQVQLAIAEDSVANASDILSTNLPDNNRLVLNAEGVATFSVTARQDNLPEVSELFRVNVFDVNNTSNSTSADVTIFDVTPLSIRPNRSSIFEQPGSPDTVIYTITGTPGTTVQLSIAPDSVATASDILSTNLPSNNLLTLNASGTATFSVTARQDNMPENDELFRVRVNEVDNQSNNAFADVTIRDFTQLAIIPNRSRIYEQPGMPDTVTYTITGSPGSTVLLAIAPNSVANVNDILSTNLPNNNSLILNASGIATFSVTARQDNVTEIDELFRVSVTDVNNPINTAIADVTIIDIIPLTMSPSRNEIYEQPGTPNTVTYTITGSPGTNVQLAIADNSVAKEDDIFSVNLPDNNRLTLDVNGVARFSVTALQDEMVEGSELFRVIVSDANHPSNSAAADVVIRDVPPITITPDRLVIFEEPGTPNTVIYTITGTPGSIVELSIGPGSIADANDILSTNLPENNRMTLNSNGIATFSVTARQDELEEDDELFRVTVTDFNNPNNNAFADITIRDIPLLSITPDRTLIYEQPGSPHAVTYSVTGLPGSEILISRDSEESSADGNDYVLSAVELGTLVDDSNAPNEFIIRLNGDGEARFVITAFQDFISEDPESLILLASEINNPDNIAFSDTVTIFDTDPFRLTVGIDTLTGTDGDDTFYAYLDEDGFGLLATLNTGDTVDGGAGFDTLEAELLTGSVAPTLNNIEKVVLWGYDESAVFDISNSIGIASIETYGEGTYVTVTANDSTAFNDIALYGWLDLNLIGNYSPQSDEHLEIWGSLLVNSSSRQEIDLSNQTDELEIEFRYSSEDSLILSENIDIGFYGVVLNYTNETFSAPISISNFNADRDQIIFDLTQETSFFSSLPGGNLSEFFLAGNFEFGSLLPSIEEPDIYLIYDTSSGILYYDADEAGDIAPVEILQLIGAPELSAEALIAFQ